jgi:hypothetical protein
LIILWGGRSARETERVLKVHNTTVYRVAKSFREREASLWESDFEWTKKRELDQSALRQLFPACGSSRK